MIKPALWPVAAVSLSLFAGSAPAQTVNLWPGPAPGSEDWTQKEAVLELPMGKRVINVVTPTLTLFLPEKRSATGTGVIIAPGGAFIRLAIDHEGYDVARWLQQRGIAAFVLKYRVARTSPEDHAAAPGRGTPGARAPAAGRSGGANMRDNSKYGIADGLQAIKVVREHAAEWGVSPDRVGFMGFSAGAIITSAILLQPDAAARPAFAAPIYGGPFGETAIPASLPPVFLAWAQDDPLAASMEAKFYDALRAAGHKPEVHIFSGGGHGFGMQKKGTTSDYWPEEFHHWLVAQGFTKRP